MALILTFAEARDGRLRRASLEVVSEARRLAGPLGATVATVVVGPGGETLAGELSAQGADRVLVFDDPALRGGIDGIRISPNVFTSLEEVNRLADAIRKFAT